MTSATGIMFVNLSSAMAGKQEPVPGYYCTYARAFTPLALERKQVSEILSVSVGVVVSILAWGARGVGFEPRPCHHASVWDRLTTASAGSGLQTK